MSDVEKDTEVTTEESDFEGHKKFRGANDEPAADEAGEDFEGHKKFRGANDEPAADEAGEDCEGHRQVR